MRTVFSHFVQSGSACIRRVERYNVNRAVARYGVPLRSFVGNVVELRVFRFGSRRRDCLSREIQTVVLIALNGVVVTFDITALRRVVLVETSVRRRRFRRANAVQNERTEVYVRIGRIIFYVAAFRFFHEGFFEGVGSDFRVTVLYGIANGVVRRGYGSRACCVYAVNLVILRRRRSFFVQVVRNAHRVVYVGVGHVLRIIEEGRFRARNEDSRRARFYVVGFKSAVLFVHTVYHAALFYETVFRRVGSKTEEVIVLPVHGSFAAVKLRTLEVDVRVCYFTRLGIFVRRRGCVVNVFAIDEKTCGVVACYEQRRNDDFRRVILCLCKLRLRDTHKRALYYVAVGVVRRVAFRAVDEINVVALFYCETAVRGNGSRRVVCAFKVFTSVLFCATACKCKRRECKRRRRNNTDYFFALIH